MANRLTENITFEQLFSKAQNVSTTQASKRNALSVLQSNSNFQQKHNDIKLKHITRQGHLSKDNPKVSRNGRNTVQASRSCKSPNFSIFTDETNVSEEKENISEEVVNVIQETENFAHETENFAHETENFAHETENFAHKTENFAHKTENFPQKTVRFVEETKNLTQETENLHCDNISSNVTNLYKDDNYEEIPENNSQESDFYNDLDLTLTESRVQPKRSSPGKQTELDTFYNTQYCNDIYWYLREVEKNFRPRAAYMKKQPDITIGMRSVLVDWLVEVSEEYKLHAETLYLAVSYIDRFLSSMSVLRGKLQLVGTACMFIAAKYEEIYPPELKDFVYVTDDTYSKKQVLRMEHLILRVLAFDLSSPTAYLFLQHFCTMSDSSDKICYLSQYICELALLEAEPFLKYLPSEIAAASLILANYTLGYVPWNEDCETFTGYTLHDLLPCISSLFNRYSTITTYPQQAICEKYKSSKFLNVSSIQPPESLAGSMMQ